MRVKFSRRPQVAARVVRDGLVAHSGSRLLAERSGLETELSKVLAPRARRSSPLRPRPGHGGPGSHGGGRRGCILDRAVLRQQPELFGEVASTPTAWQVLGSIEEAMLARLTTAVARAAGQGLELGAGPRPCDTGLRLHSGGGGVGEQAAGRTELEARIWVPPPAGVSGPGTHSTATGHPPT